MLIFPNYQIIFAFSPSDNNVFAPNAIFFGKYTRYIREAPIIDAYGAIDYVFSGPSFWRSDASTGEKVDHINFLVTL